MSRSPQDKNKPNKIHSFTQHLQTPYIFNDMPPIMAVPFDNPNKIHAQKDYKYEILYAPIVRHAH